MVDEIPNRSMNTQLWLLRQQRMLTDREITAALGTPLNKLPAESAVLPILSTRGPCLFTQAACVVAVFCASTAKPDPAPAEPTPSEQQAPSDQQAPAGGAAPIGGGHGRRLEGEGQGQPQGQEAESDRLAGAEPPGSMNLG